MFILTTASSLQFPFSPLWFPNFSSYFWGIFMFPFGGGSVGLGIKSSAGIKAGFRGAGGRAAAVQETHGQGVRPSCQHLWRNCTQL